MKINRLEVIPMDGFSKPIEDFIKFLRYCTDTNRRAAVQEMDLENQIQDILHNIEFTDNYPDDYVQLGFALKDIRKKRRIMKDVQRCTMPIKTWANDNQKVINELEKLLGAVRKAEKSTIGRHYMNRTNVLDKILDKEE